MKYIKKTNKHKPSLSILMGIFLFVLLLLAYFIHSFFYTKPYAVYKYSNDIPMPKVDVGSCYTTNAVSIQLFSDKNYKIYYTLDGTIPNEKSIVYDGNKIVIDDNISKDTFLYSIPTSPRWKQPIGDVFCFKVLRAICVDEKGNNGKELKASYFIDKQKKHHYSIPIFSFIFNPEDLFGYKNGIYIMGKSYEDKDNYVKKKIKFDIPWWQYPANYLQKGQNSDRNVFVEYFCLNENKSYSFNSTMRIHGFNTRGFSQKSFRVPVEHIDSSCIRMFDENKTKINYIFRNGGNDWTKTLLRDAYIHEVMKGTSLSPQAYQPVVCFFNGEYWGIHTLRERFDEYYIQNKYEISKDSISILELEGQILCGLKSEMYAFKNTIDFMLNHDMSIQENYTIVEKEIDIQNLIDYTIANIFFVNNDWPTNNLKYWRYSYPSKDSMYRDNRWRFVLSDMDWAMGFNIDNAHEYDMFKFIKDKKPFGLMFNQLMLNRKFKKQFYTSFVYHIENLFNSEKLNSILRDMEENLFQYIPENCNRWRVIGSYSTWVNNVNVLKEFNDKRSKFVLEQLNALIFKNLENQKTF